MSLPRPELTSPLRGTTNPGTRRVPGPGSGHPLTAALSLAAPRCHSSAPEAGRRGRPGGSPHAGSLFPRSHCEGSKESVSFPSPALRRAPDNFAPADRLPEAQPAEDAPCPTPGLESWGWLSSFPAHSVSTQHIQAAKSNSKDSAQCGAVVTASRTGVPSKF